MPDERTLAHYEREAPSYIARYTAVAPPRPRELMRAFFPAGGRVVDVGCGAGRDLEWLRAEGYDVEGVEPVEGFAAACEGRAGLAGVKVHRAALPELAPLRAEGSRAGSFDGALVSAVLMHLPRWEVPRALESVLWLLRPGGRAVLSVRAPQGAGGEQEGEREREGERLFTALSLAELRLMCEVVGGRAVLWEETLESPAVSAGLGRGAGVAWRTVVVERPRAGEGDGLTRVQTVLLHDHKTSTYKFALLRALCDLARERPFCGRYDERAPRVWVPLRAVAAMWAQYYWPLRGVAQIHPGRSLGVFLVFERLLWRCEREAEPLRVLRDLLSHQLLSGEMITSDGKKSQSALSAAAAEGEPPGEGQGADIAEALKEISLLILKGPVTYTTDEEGAPVFGRATGREAGGGEWALGAISVPAEMWADLRRHWHWVEDSLIARWARFSHGLDPARPTHEIQALLDQTRHREDGEEQRRATQEVRALMEQPAHAATLRRCVWSGEELPLSALDVDHVIPFSLRRQNELWNLLPAAARLNRAKGDALPTPSQLRAARERILSVWALYAGCVGGRLARDLAVGLGVSLGEGERRAAWSAALDLAFERLCLLASAALSSQQARPWRGAEDGRRAPLGKDKL